MQTGNGDFNLGKWDYEPKNKTRESLPIIVSVYGAGERSDGAEKLEKVICADLLSAERRLLCQDRIICLKDMNVK